MQKAGLIGILALQVCTPILAEPLPPDPAANPLQPSGPWNLNSTLTQCQMIRNFGSDASALTMVLAEGAGSGRYDAVFAGTAIGKLPEKAKFELKLMPKGQTQEVFAETGTIPQQKGRYVRWFDADERFLDNFESNPQVSLSGPKGFAVAIALRGAGGAVKALRSCRMALLQSWGVDTEAMGKLAVLPEPDIPAGGGNPGTVIAILVRASPGASTAEVKRAARDQQTTIPAGAWVSGMDYPTEALRQERSGAVTMALELNTEGRVDGCRIVVSSNFAPLDQASCAALHKRAKYKPARLVNGEAVRSTVIERIRWLIPAI